MSKNPVIIFGAGPAGLTAAYELEKYGKKSLLLESDTQVGGISKTINYKGNRFDIGGHRFFSKVPYINEVWDEILGDEFLTRDRLSRILYKEHFFDYPLKPLNAISGLGLQESLHVIFSYAWIKAFPQATQSQENFEQWVTNRFGSKLYEIFFKTYTEKVWGMKCTDISADWASQRIKNFSLSEAIRNAFFTSAKNTKGEVITTIIDRFKYPRLGPGMMWEYCQNFLENQGSSILLGERVNKIRHHKNEVIHVIAENKKGEQTSYRSEEYISSMPLREMILCMDPLPPEDVIKAAKSLRYRDYFTVVLTINREEVFPDNWIYVHTPEVKLGRIQNYKNWSPDMVSNPKHSTLGLEYFLWENDPEWNWPNKWLTDLGVRECTQINLIKPNEVLDGSVIRMKKAYPVYDINYVHNVEKIKAYLQQFQNLQTIGRNGLHRYNNQDHSMLTGIYAARNLFGKNYDVWSVNTERKYQEDLDRGKVLDRGIPVRVDGNKKACKTSMVRNGES